jgi:PAS domain S-box-containing protein
MPRFLSLKPLDSFKTVSRLCGTAIFFMASAALAGWFLDMRVLASVRTGYIPMAPNTALAFMILAGGLIALESRSPRGLLAARIGAGLVVAVASVRLLEYTTGRVFGVDQWIFRFPSEMLGLAPVGRMAFFTALCFIFTGAAVFLVSRPGRGRGAQGTAAALSVVALSLGLGFLLGYLYGKPLGYQGRTIPMAFNTALCFFLAGTGLLTRIVAWDRQERRRVQDAAQRLAAIVESSDDAIIGKALDGAVTSWNRGAEALYGYSAKEMIGRRIHVLLPDGADDDISPILDRIRAGQPVRNYETRRRRKDGSVVSVSISVSPVRDERDRITGGAVIARNITESKRLEAELEQRVKDLENLNREMEAFSYSVSHDLRAPLRHISGFADLLKKGQESALNDQGRRYLGLIIESAKEMGTLIDDLLAFSRTGRAEMQKERVDLNRLVQDVVASLQPSVDGREVAWRVDRLPDIQGDRAMLKQVMMNLLSNAVKYTRPRSQAVVEIGCRNGTPGETVVYVRDNGVGFDMKYAGNLFGVFQRLHATDQFEGTGIGLANVRRIVERHGGRVWAESAVGQGATFFVSIPGGGGA